ncbi:hypothetical protein ACFLRA_03020, partial [Bdellovibrionota bacterium]
LGEEGSRFMYFPCRANKTLSILIISIFSIIFTSTTFANETSLEDYRTVVNFNFNDFLSAIHQSSCPTVPGTEEVAECENYKYLDHAPQEIQTSRWFPQVRRDIQWIRRGTIEIDFRIRNLEQFSRFLIEDNQSSPAKDEVKAFIDLVLGEAHLVKFLTAEDGDPSRAREHLASAMEFYQNKADQTANDGCAVRTIEELLALLPQDETPEVEVEPQIVEEEEEPSIDLLEFPEPRTPPPSPERGIFTFPAIPEPPRVPTSSATQRLAEIKDQPKYDRDKGRRIKREHLPDISLDASYLHLERYTQSGGNMGEAILRVERLLTGKCPINRRFTPRPYNFLDTLWEGDIWHSLARGFMKRGLEAENDIKANIWAIVAASRFWQNGMQNLRRLGLTDEQILPLIERFHRNPQERLRYMRELRQRYPATQQ